MSKKFTVYESENVIEALSVMVKELSDNKVPMCEVKGRVAAILNARGHEEAQPAVANALPLKIRRKFQTDADYDMMTRLELIEMCKDRDIIYTHRKKHDIVYLLREYDERVEQGLCGLTHMSEEDMYRRVLKSTLVELCKHRKVVFPNDAKKDVLVERLLECSDKTFGDYSKHHPRLLVNLCRHRGMPYQNKRWEELAYQHREYDMRDAKKHDIVPKDETQAPKRLKMER